MMANIGIEGMESRVASITVDRPKAGETLTVAVTPGLRVVLEFDPAAAKFAVEGADFVLTLEDGGQVVFAGLVTAAQGGDVPTLHVAGIDIDASVLMKQVLALAEEAEAEPIETAAGEDGEGEEGAAEDGGGSHYDDSFGDLIAGLIKQGVIGETELGFGLIGNGGTEFLIEAEFLSEGYMPRGGGGGPLGVGVPSGSGPLAPTSGGPGDAGGSPSLPDPAASPGGDGGGESGPATLSVNDMDIITNQTTGNLQIPDELILYLADAEHGAGLSVSGPSYDGVTDNAFICAAGDPMPDATNTWVADGNDHIRFHIGGGTPFYEGSFSFDASDGLGATGSNTIGVKNFATAKAGSYWTLDGTDADEVLLGLDGRNLIDGGGGDDIIHGGHDSSGDILIGGDGDDVIFGGSGKDDLRGGDGDDTFIMRAGFSRDTVDGGADSDTISLQSVLTDADVASDASISNWLTADQGFTHDAATDTITFDATASGTIDLGGGNEITFVKIEQIDYALLG